MDLIGDLLPPGVLNVVNGFGVECRQAAGAEQADRQGRVHRRDLDRPADHAVRVGEHHPGHARARRQVARTSSSPTSWPRTTTSSTRRSKASPCSRSTRARSAPARAASLVQRVDLRPVHRAGGGAGRRDQAGQPARSRHDDRRPGQQRAAGEDPGLHRHRPPGRCARC